MDAAEFDAVVSEAVQRLPEHVRTRLTNVAVLIEDEPDEELRKEEELAEGDTLLGLYRGIPATERGSDYGIGGTLPDTITIFRLPTIEAAEADAKPGEPLADAIRRVVADTLWHEIGHYFGLHEHEIGIREDEGTNRYPNTSDAA